MANEATTYLEHRILNFIFKNNVQVGGTNFGSGNSNGLGNDIYVGLATAVSDGEAGSVTEANYTNYARQQVAAASWTLASSSSDTQTCKNTNAIEFPASGGGGDDAITHVFIADASSSGNLLFVGTITNRTISTGDIFRINAEQLIITAT